jgi:hypothetical protein
MLASGGGTIVNMASLAGLQGVANLAGATPQARPASSLTKVAASDHADQGRTGEHGRRRGPAALLGPLLLHHRRNGPDRRRPAGLKPNWLHHAGEPVATSCDAVGSAWSVGSMEPNIRSKIEASWDDTDVTSHLEDAREPHHRDSGRRRR